MNSAGFPSKKELREGISGTALAFRGFNVTNIGKTPELLAIPAYADFLRPPLKRASEIAAEHLHRAVDLEAMIRERREPGLEKYGEGIAINLAVSEAHTAILRHLFNIPTRSASVSFGYSLGEIAALAHAGTLRTTDALNVLLPLAEDCAALAEGTTLAVTISRNAACSIENMGRIMQEVNAEGIGVMGVSTLLSPNAMIVVGQTDTLARFQQLARKELDAQFALRRREHRLPPLHTCLAWQRSIPDRAAVQMQSMPISGLPPKLPLLSMVTGGKGYDGLRDRELLRLWVDHPQLLWNVMMESLATGVETIIHIGPEPNLLPASFARLRDNMAGQLKESFGKRALSAVMRRPWLTGLMPQQVSLLRAPFLKQFNLEDWLLANAP